MSFNQEKINSIFSNIASSYDKMNNFMSFGLHTKWKKQFVNLIKDQVEFLLYSKDDQSNYNFQDLHQQLIIKQHNKQEELNFEELDFQEFNDQDNSGQHYVEKDIQDLQDNKLSLFDCATGSCDIPILLNAVPILRNNLEITCSDVNVNMLKYGREKLKKSDNLNAVKMILADAINLPIIDNSFNFYSIVFGIRNIVKRDLALKEAFRILKPGGYFFCMEFNRPNYLFSKFYSLYAKILPKLGQVVANDAFAYEYLSDSIIKFPTPFEFSDAIKRVGFSDVKVINIYFSLVNIFIAKKP